MRSFGVKELAQMSGVSVRTLHYYDEIGLLQPSERTESGYRRYGQDELLKLQQILFYRELDFPLNDIKLLLDIPDYDRIDALEKHRLALGEQRNRLSKLLKTIDFTIKNLKNNSVMKKPEKLYEGLPREFGTTYRAEAIQKYGRKRVETSEKKLMKLSKQDYKDLQSGLESISQQLFTLKDKDPRGNEIQNLVAEHYEIIRQFWGTGSQSDRQAESYAGLGELYVQDERYTTIDDKPQPEFARFLRDAMRYFADNSLKH